MAKSMPPWCGLIGIVMVGAAAVAGAGDAPIRPVLRLATPASLDQDDVCVWVHPTAPEKSRIVTSDKKANEIAVYDLQGQVIERHPASKPGNIDIRQAVILDGRPTDIVVVNQRDPAHRLLIYKVSPAGSLERIDGDLAPIGPNYGGCLSYDARSRGLSFVCTSEEGLVQQYELSAITGGVSAKAVRSISLGKCEGAVADDELGSLYISVEQQGVWKMPADPADPSSGEFIVRVGEGGVLGDLEGLAIYRTGPGQGFLIVSDQGHDCYRVYDRAAPHRNLGEFRIEGASKTDGIEAVAAPLGSAFPRGLFACHTDQAPRPLLVSSWEDIAAALPAPSLPTR